MNAYEAKIFAALEALAHAKGLPLWQYEMAQTVDDKLIEDLRADARRGDPSIPTSLMPAPQRTAEEILEAEEAYERREQRRKEAEERAVPYPVGSEGWARARGGWGP